MNQQEVATFLKENRPIIDQTINQKYMFKYGYSYEEMIPLRVQKALELYQKGIIIYLLYDNNTEARAESIEEIEKHAAYDGIFGVEFENYQRDLAHKEQPHASKAKVLKMER